MNYLVLPLHSQQIHRLVLDDTQIILKLQWRIKILLYKSIIYYHGYSQQNTYS
jgi:hypothetical protein